MKPLRAEIGVRLAPLALAVLWIGLAGRLPETWTLCGFRWLTGHPCPLCGMTHALAALANGQWNEALALHALSPLAAALLLALPLLALAPRFERRAWQGTAALFAAFGFLRLL